MKLMGESDVKFVLYVALFGDMCVDSFDSDVLLIAALYVSRNSYSGNIYVRWYKTRLAQPCKKRKLGDGDDSAFANTPVDKKRLEYEIIHVNLLIQVLHTRMNNASTKHVEITSLMTPAHLTTMLLFMVLLCGCDYSKKLPRVEAKSLCDNFDVVVTAILACTTYTNNVFSVDADQSINSLIALLYTRIYTKHVQKGLHDPSHSMQTVLRHLHSSTLSEKTKLELPTHVSFSIRCGILSG